MRQGRRLLALSQADLYQLVDTKLDADLLADAIHDLRLRAVRLLSTHILCGCRSRRACTNEGGGKQLSSALKADEACAHAPVPAMSMSKSSGRCCCGDTAAIRQRPAVQAGVPLPPRTPEVTGGESAPSLHNAGSAILSGIDGPAIFATQSSLGPGSPGGASGDGSGLPPAGSPNAAMADSIQAGAPTASQASLSFTGRTQSQSRVSGCGLRGAACARHGDATRVAAPACARAV